MIVSAMKTNANTFRLPEEILEQIFGYLGQADLARVGSVNTVFWRLAVARLYHEIRFDPYAYRESQLRVLKRLVFFLFIFGDNFKFEVRGICCGCHVHFVCSISIHVNSLTHSPRTAHHTSPASSAVLQST